MSFATPTILFFLLAVPALALFYMAVSRRQRRAADAFANPALGASVAPRRPGARRHLPVIVMLLAVSALIVALARPQRTVAVPVERAQIMLVTDVSGSMTATDVAPDRLRAAQAAARRFVGEVPKNVNVGIMTFNQIPRMLQSPTTDREALSAAISQYKAQGGTATGEAIKGALAALQRTPAGDGGKRPPSAIVLLSDGASTKGVDPLAAAREAGRAKVPISTVALGTAQGTITVPRPGGKAGTETRRVPPDPDSLRAIARASGGRSYDAASAEGLSSVYKQLGSQLGRRKERRDMTAGAAGIAAALLLGASILSLRWFGRLA